MVATILIVVNELIATARGGREAQIGMFREPR
jgi:hypothetical protein